MIDETIKQIEARIANSPNLSEENRQELIKLVADLREEVTDLAEADADKAAAITASANAATDPDDEGTLDGLTETVREFEVSHPRLTQTVHNICNVLSNIGI